MISISEKQVLESICKKSREALLDIHTIIGKLENQDVILQLNRQGIKYSRLQEKAEDILLEEGIMPGPIGIAERIRRLAIVQGKLSLGSSEGAVAALILKENRNRLKGVAKLIKENDIISSMTYELAEEFLDFEQENIRTLKSYQP